MWSFYKLCPILIKNIVAEKLSGRSILEEMVPLICVVDAAFNVPFLLYK